jgi:hypothetical protein
MGVSGDPQLGGYIVAALSVAVAIAIVVTLLILRAALA